MGLNKGREENEGLFDKVKDKISDTVDDFKGEDEDTVDNDGKNEDDLVNNTQNEEDREVSDEDLRDSDVRTFNDGDVRESESRNSVDEEELRKGKFESEGGLVEEYDVVSDGDVVVVEEGITENEDEVGGLGNAEDDEDDGLERV